ncbi:MAG: efflux RND transporter periplasmic adaptor subunit [Accumulibacter sp.]|uniref:efflux RND transporter periplasmic adaptor subunit n=1 Tax=Accumulibacter sp. TaxID=2053492 RepID=UPI003315FE16
MTEPDIQSAGFPLQPLRIDRSGSAARPVRHRRWLWIAVALLVVVSAVWLLLPRTSEVRTSSVLVSTPSQQYVQLVASGYVVAQRRAAVASKASGRLIELHVREGSVVKKQQVIARIDASDVEAAIVAAQAGVRQAEAGENQAAATLQQARVEQANAAADLQRTLGLQSRGFVSPQAVDGARRRADSALATVAGAQAGVNLARAARAQAQAQVQVQRVNEDFTLIRAPFDGVVLVKNANVGDIITPFSSAVGAQGAVVTMADMSTLEVEADVSESNIGKVAIGQPVEIVLDALPDVRFRGKVAGIVPTVDRAKATVMTKIQFEKLDPRILPEMSAKASFLSRMPEDADLKPVLAVNPQSLRERDGRTEVLRVGADNRLEAVPVQRGRNLGELVEVIDARSDGAGALKSGDKLVLSPDAGLASGTMVKVAAK